MTTTNQSLAPGDSAGARGGFDVRVLALASLAAVLGWTVGHAFGGGLVATVVCASVMPWITAFLTHPGPHRVRRVAAVLVFSGLVAMCRKGVDAARAAVRRTAGKPPDHRVAAGGSPAHPGMVANLQSVSAPARRLTHAWLGHVTLTAAVSLVPAAALITAREVIRDPAAAAAGPTLRVPEEDVVAYAGHRSRTRVTYHVTAVDDRDNPLSPACRPRSGALFRLGRTAVTCSAIDASGRRAKESFLVTVLGGGTQRPSDHDKPALTVPDDFTHDATTPGGANVTYAASARDSRDGALTPHCLPISGGFFALGRTRVACTATDAAGNTAHAGFTVTVVRAGDADHTPPDITVPDPIESPATSKDGAKVTYVVSATDNRDGSLKPTCDSPSGSVFKVGTTSVTCSAEDTAGNKASESFMITVTGETSAAADLTSPDITVPGPMKVAATSEDGAKVSYTVLATDNRDGPLKPTCDPASGSVFKIGTTTVTCSAQDAAGNRAGKSFIITVTPRKSPPGGPPPDRTPPSITVPDPINVDATGKDGAKVSYTASATDDRDGPLKPTCDPASGSVFKIGTTTVTCVVRDNAGNKATNTFTVSVIDRTPPSNGASPPPIAVTATASAIRDSYSGPCPPPTDTAPYFKGVISVSRGPVTVQYAWRASNNGSSDPSVKTMTFSGSGAQQQTVNYTDTSYLPNQTFTDWVALYIYAPVNTESNHVSFTTTCAGSGPS
jgi:hypothetical protein